MFTPYGDLDDNDAVFMLPSKPGSDKACGFVKFKDPAHADLAIASLKDQVVLWPSHPGHNEAILVRHADAGAGKKPRFM